MKYKLEKNIPKKRYYEVTIKAEYSNDADYIEGVGYYYQEEFDKIVDDIIDLKNNYSGRYELEKYEGEELSIPYSDYGRCHTLYSIDIMMYDTDGCSYIVKIGEDK
jgi:hypothetical protein